MDIHEAVNTRVEIREYTDERIPDAVKREILDAGRLAPSGHNLQHWRFILIETDERLAGVADRSPSGAWVRHADFAVAIATDPSHGFHQIDAGRAVTHMQMLAWAKGVGSCIFTVDSDDVKRYLEIPDTYTLSLVAAFGRPTRDRFTGQKDRQPLEEIAFSERFGEKLHSQELQND